MKELPKLSPAFQKFWHGIYNTTRQLMESEHHLAPVAFFIRHDVKDQSIQLHPNQVSPCMIPMPDNHNGKDAAALLLKKIGYRIRATAVLTVLEAWMSKPNLSLNKKEALEWANNNPPSTDPNRVEIVMYSFEIKGVGTYSCMAEITRDDKDIPSLPSETPIFEGVFSEGRFAGILDYEPKTPSAFELGLTDVPDVPGFGCKIINGNGEEISEEETGGDN